MLESRLRWPVVFKVTRPGQGMRPKSSPLLRTHELIFLSLVGQLNFRVLQEIVLMLCSIEERTVGKNIAYDNDGGRPTKPPLLEAEMK